MKEQYQRLHGVERACFVAHKLFSFRILENRWDPSCIDNRTAETVTRATTSLHSECIQKEYTPPTNQLLMYYNDRLGTLLSIVTFGGLVIAARL